MHDTQRENDYLNKSVNSIGSGSDGGGFAAQNDNLLAKLKV
jgi:hypothetical protein